MGGRKIEMPEKMTFRDAYRSVLSVIMVALGLVILNNAARGSFSVPALMLGAALLLFGLYRLYFVWLFFRKR
jgi:uncharacterized membrane protein HdeD (DUF308 family)